MLKDLEESSEVRIVGADVTSLAGVERIFAEIKDFPPLKGIFNVANLSSDEFPEKLSALAISSQHLHDVSQKMGVELDYFVMFTSVAESISVLDLNTIAANSAYISCLSHQRLQQGLPSMSLQMGRVQGVNIDNEIDRAQENHGMKSLHFHEYLKILGHLLQSDYPPPVITVSYQVG